VRAEERGLECAGASRRGTPQAEHRDAQQRALLKFGHVALILPLTLAGACGAPARSVAGRPAQSEMSPTASAPPLQVLRAMSFTHHDEPRNQILFEGDEPRGSTELRLLAADDTLVAAGTSVPNPGDRLCADPRTARPSPTGSALRVVVDLGSQELLHEVIEHPERYRVELRTRADGWRPIPFRFECHAQE
jgi:hypothetical protein